MEEWKEHFKKSSVIFNTHGEKILNIKNIIFRVSRMVMLTLYYVLMLPFIGQFPLVFFCLDEWSQWQQLEHLETVSRSASGLE